MVITRPRPIGLPSSRPHMFCVVEQMRLSPNVPAQKIRDQFTAAFEGGSNYFLQSAALMKADVHPTRRPWYSCPEVFEKSFEIELGYDDPSEYEGFGNGRKTITEADVRSGLDVMRRDHPKQFAKVMSGDGDADTADVFLQCCLFGKVVYG
jgi:hypothetical protein